jgi:hypothetical protein
MAAAASATFAAMVDTPRAVDALSADWTVAVLLVVFGCLTYASMVAPRKLGLLAMSFFAFRLGKQAQRDELDLRDRTLTVLFVAAVVLVALFTYQLLVFSGALSPGFGHFLRALLLATGALLAPLLLLRGIAWVTASAIGVAEYFHTVVLFNIVLGLSLLPATMLLAFPAHTGWRTWIWPAGALLVLLVLGFRWVRAAVIGWGEGVPTRYILLYLCAAEIMPVALAYQQARHLFPELPHPL